MSDDRRKEAKRLCIEQGWTQGAAAQKLGVSRRTVERWASEDGWGAVRTAHKVVAIDSKAQKSKAKSTPKPLGGEKLRAKVNPRPRLSTKEIDEQELVDIALCDISSAMGGDIDPKGIASCATALCRLIELRLKLKPRTAAEVAELAIGLGITPADFVTELKEQWQLRA